MKTMPLPNAFAEILRDTLDEWPSAQKEIAAATGILASHLSEMKAGRRRCTPEYDLRFSRYFGTSPGFCLRLQLDYELMRATRDSGERIEREVQPHAA